MSEKNGENRAPVKGQYMTQEEYDLVRKLVQARMERQADLEYEDLEGYQVPPRTQFSMLKKPTVSIKYRECTFNMACIRLFEGVQNVLLIAHEGKQRLAVVPCAEEESASVEWARKKNEVWVNKTITSEEFVESIYKLMNWDRGCRYKAIGRVATSARGLILIFDLVEAVMFNLKPEEFTDPQTGEVKKRFMKFFPDIYKDKIGRSYNDYLAMRQISMFEDIQDYEGPPKTGEHPPPDHVTE